MYEGNQKSTLGKYFEIAGEAGATAGDTHIVVKGDVTKVKYIGMKMTAGEVIVEGSTDMYVGAWMQAVRSTSRAMSRHLPATGMKGGELIIDGNAGNYLGCCIPWRLAWHAGR